MIPNVRNNQAGERVVARFVAVGLALAMSAPAFAQDDGIVIDFGHEDSAAVHVPVGDQRVAIVPAFEDYAYMMYDICDVMGLDVLNDGECSIYPMNGELGGNALATMADGNRIIVYDRELSPIIGGDGAEMIIAHEVAHHYCGHLDVNNGPLDELEADAFAGAAMRMLGRPIEAALSAVAIFSERPSQSHPDRQSRIRAITMGWNDPAYGASCGGRKVGAATQSKMQNFAFSRGTTLSPRKRAEK